MSEQVNHPAHYGGQSNPYEAIKVIEAWGLGFCLGNTVKYLARAAHKGESLQDLKKARWYLDRAIQTAEQAAPLRVIAVLALSALAAGCDGPLNSGPKWACPSGSELPRWESAYDGHRRPNCVVVRPAEPAR